MPAIQMKTITVIISKEDKDAITDWNVKAWYDNLLQTGDTAVVATPGMLNALRVGVRLGEISPFSFDFEGETIHVAGDARLSNWPSGFMDHQAKDMFTIMTGKSREEATALHSNQ